MLFSRAQRRNVVVSPSNTLQIAILAILFLFSTLSSAHSRSRNPLTAIATVHDVAIKTPSRRVNALQTFELELAAFRRRYRLKLEPNYDVLPEGATVSYLGEDGEVERTEVIDRLQHKVFQGETWGQNVDGSYSRVGIARITIYQDGEEPLFEGVLGVDREHYHIQLVESYDQTKHEEDPDVEITGEDYMIVWRDSDLHVEDSFKVELKRDVHDQVTCEHDSLDFNSDPNHPVYTGIGEQDDSTWGFTPITSLFGKRQLDTSTGGNGAGVNLVSSIGSTAGCPSMRKVALVGVATDCSYTNTFANESAARSNVIQQMNSASSLYEKTFNISLGLANLVVSPSSCPASASESAPWNVGCSNSVTIQDRLNLFSGWRGKQNDNFSHWTLLTNCNTGSEVGLAWLGQACVGSASSMNVSTGNGGTSNGQTVSGANVVAKTSTEWQVIAHETGHTFGAVHDCTSQTCSDGTSTKQQCCPLSSSTCDAGSKYIMNPSTGNGINQFSACSVGNICSAIGRNSVKTTCLSNNRNVPLITGQQCGNGIVETGEDCDCGGTAGCGTNACCDPTTCKFKSGAVCDDSNEDCCKGCQMAPSSQVCRPSTGVCDPAESCTGTSPTCPSDITAPDGKSCGSGLTCATGHCTSRDAQCKTLMGSYTNNNDTYACDSTSCTISCASPEFGNGVCYGLQQNFLDGTACGGGGKCSNGQCKGSSFTKEIKSWIDSHKGLVIGIASAIGALILLMLLSCCWRVYKRRQYRKAAAMAGPYPPGVYASGANRSIGGRNYSRASVGTRGNPPQFYGIPPPPMQQRVDPHVSSPRAGTPMSEPPPYPGPPPRGGTWDPNLQYPMRSVRYA